MAKEPVRRRGKNFPTQNVLYSRVKSVDAFNTVDVLPNPDPVLKELNNAWTNYQEILWDPHLTAVVSSRKAPTLSKEWIIERGKSPARVAKFIEEAFKMFDVHRATEEILDAQLYGMQPMEPVWDRPQRFEGENKIFPIEFIGRPPWWFQYDNVNKIRFRSLENPWPGEEIAPYSLIVPRNNPKYDNPYGDALYSKIYWAVNFKKGAFKFWVEYAEKYGSPFIEGRPPRNASDTEFEEFHEKIVEMTKGSAITIPKDAELVVHAMGNKSSSDAYKLLVDFANAEISKGILGHGAAADSTPGKLGNENTQLEVRHDIAESDEILCEGTFNQLIRWIVDLNFGENIIAPTFEYEHEEDVKMELAERDKVLREMGVKFSPDYYIENYNLKETDFEVVDPEPQKQDPKDPKEKPEFAEALKSKFADQRALDNFINSLSDQELQKQAKFVKPVIDMISKANSFEEANEKLLGLFSKIRPEALEKNLGRALFNAQNLGIGGDD